MKSHRYKNATERDQHLDKAIKTQEILVLRRLHNYNERNRLVYRVFQSTCTGVQGNRTELTLPVSYVINVTYR